MKSAFRSLSLMQAPAKPMQLGRMAIRVEVDEEKERKVTLGSETFKLSLKVVTCAGTFRHAPAFQGGRASALNEAVSSSPLLVVMSGREEIPAEAEKFWPGLKEPATSARAMFVEGQKHEPAACVCASTKSRSSNTRQVSGWSRGEGD